MEEGGEKRIIMTDVVISLVGSWRIGRAIIRLRFHEPRTVFTFTRRIIINTAIKMMDHRHDPLRFVFQTHLWFVRRLDHNFVVVLVR